MASLEAHPGQLCVSVVYALPDEQHSVRVMLPSGATVADAVERSGFLRRFSAIADRPLQCAVFNRVVDSAELVVDGDRVEILRPLQADPKQRRRLAARTRGTKRA